MTTNLLEERLRNLELDLPDPRRISARVLARNTRPRRRALPRVAIGSVASLALLAMIAYFAPAADVALADLPIAGDLIRNAGLVGARDRITSVGSSGTSSGYTVTLVGAYADSTRTVLLVHGQPAAVALGGHATITDQFGRAYMAAGGKGDLLTGDSVIEFEPFAWPDGITGARITLQISELETTPDLRTGGVRGSWTMRATLGMDEGTSLALPAGATLGKAHFKFTSVRYTPASIAVDMDATGVSSDELGRIEPNGLKGSPAFQLELFDPGGANVIGSWGWDDDWLGVIHVHLLGYREASGQYTLSVSYEGATFERTLMIS